jgi:hypothetical protein
MRSYDGHCHCGALRFKLRCEPITTAVRCNCSMCLRKGALMSSQYFAPDQFEELSGIESLAVYLWGDRMVNHYFCRTCGVYPFHDATTKPGHYRINLGCVDDLDPLALPVTILDGRSF